MASYAIYGAWFKQGVTTLFCLYSKIKIIYILLVQEYTIFIAICCCRLINKLVYTLLLLQKKYLYAQIGLVPRISHLL